MSCGLTTGKERTRTLTIQIKYMHVLELGYLRVIRQWNGCVYFRKGFCGKFCFSSQLQ